MKQSTALATLAAFLALAAAGLSIPQPAQAKSNFMSECSAKYKAAKTSGSIAPTTKWADFMKTQCAGQGQSAQASPQTTVAKPAKAAKPASASKSSASGNFMQQCSTAWQQMKQAGTIPAGLKWTSFVKQGCTVDGNAAGQSDTADAPAPAEPTNSNYASYQSMDVAKTDKNGKPFTPGQIAAHKRIKECAAEWHQAKQSGTLPGGAKWPQYWSDCNTRLKNQG